MTTYNDRPSHCQDLFRGIEIEPFLSLLTHLRTATAALRNGLMPTNGVPRISGGLISGAARARVSQRCGGNRID